MTGAWGLNSSFDSSLLLYNVIRFGDLGFWTQKQICGFQTGVGLHDLCLIDLFIRAFNKHQVFCMFWFGCMTSLGICASLVRDLTLSFIASFMYYKSFLKHHYNLLVNQDKHLYFLVYFYWSKFVV